MIHVARFKARWLLVLTILILAIIMLLKMTSSWTSTGSVNAQQWADSLYGNSKVTAVTGGGSLYSGGTFTSGKSSINDAVMLTTSSGMKNGCTTMKGDQEIGSMLSDIAGYRFGGDLSYVEIETTALSEEFSFRYAFAASEFGQNIEYNDCFGIFVSIEDKKTGKWSSYENIAVIPETDMGVSLQNLSSECKWNTSGSLDGPATDISEKSGKAFSSVFEARKDDIIPGSSVRILFAICDISDDTYDSAVAIEATASKSYCCIDNEDDEDKTAGCTDNGKDYGSSCTISSSKVGTSSSALSGLLDKSDMTVPFSGLSSSGSDKKEPADEDSETIESQLNNASDINMPLKAYDSYPVLTEDRIDNINDLGNSKKGHQGGPASLDTRSAENLDSS